MKEIAIKITLQDSKSKCHAWWSWFLCLVEFDLTHPSDLANKVATGNWHRINVHTFTWSTVKWVNGVFNQGRLQWWFCLMFLKCLTRGINELKLILIWSTLILWFILDHCTLSEHAKRTDFEDQIGYNKNNNFDNRRISQTCALGAQKNCIIKTLLLNA